MFSLLKPTTDKLVNRNKSEHSPRPRQRETLDILSNFPSDKSHQIYLILLHLPHFLNNHNNWIPELEFHQSHTTKNY